MKIIWNTDVNAPCCPGEILSEDEKKSILVQTDWDYPGVAITFGWNMCEVGENECEHPHTDGTTDCPDCGLTAGYFIDCAREWLENHDGAIVDDPGYFS